MARPRARKAAKSSLRKTRRHQHRPKATPLSTLRSQLPKDAPISTDQHSVLISPVYQQLGLQGRVNQRISRRETNRGVGKWMESVWEEWRKEDALVERVFHDRQQVVKTEEIQGEKVDVAHVLLPETGNKNTFAQALKDRIEQSHPGPSISRRTLSHHETVIREQLVAKYGTDVAAMARDKHLNPMQFTVKQLVRKLALA